MTTLLDPGPLSRWPAYMVGVYFWAGVVSQALSTVVATAIGRDYSSRGEDAPRSSGNLHVPCAPQWHPFPHVSW
jgi:hypothetical protein